MKIKIIDLLNEIAKGEVLPKKIKYKDYVYEYDKVAKDYYRNGIDEELDTIYDLIKAGLIEKVSDSNVS